LEIVFRKCDAKV